MMEYWNRGNVCASPKDPFGEAHEPSAIVKADRSAQNGGMKTSDYGLRATHHALSTTN